MTVMLDISEKEIQRLTELVGIPDSDEVIEDIDESTIAMAIHTLIEVA